MRVFLFSLVAGGLIAGVNLTLSTAPAHAQSNICEEGAKLMSERQSLAEQLQKAAGKNKQVDPRTACTVFTRLDRNGDTMLKWMETNKDWCQVPDQVVENFTKEHKQIEKTRGEACTAAARFNEMQRRAAEQRQGGNPFGGGLTGEYKIPQGAL